MPYTVRQNGEKYDVIDGDGKVVATRATEEAADDKADRLTITERLHAINERLPKPALTVEERAELYDKMMAEKEKEKEQPPPKNDTPPPPEKKEEPPPAKEKRRSGYWGSALEDGS